MPLHCSGSGTVHARMLRADTAQMSAALSADEPCSDLALVGGEGCEDFGLLALRHLGEVQGSPEFRCDLVKFCRGDPEVPVGLLKAELRLAGLGRRKLEGPARNVADP